MDLYTITILIGVLTYILLLITILIGRRVIKLSFKMHKFFAFSTITSASFHAGLFIYMNFF